VMMICKAAAVGKERLAAPPVYITNVRQALPGPGEIVEEMGLLDRIRGAFTQEPQRIDELARLAGRCEALVNRMRRHAAMCGYPAMAKEVGEIAEREALHEKELRNLLAGYNTWPRPPQTDPREGANNWERLSGDLAILLLFSQELQRHALKWEGENPNLAQRLFEIAEESASNEMALRRITAKCDPLALD